MTYLIVKLCYFLCILAFTANSGTHTPKLHSRIVYDLNSSVAGALVGSTRDPGFDSRFWSIHFCYSMEHYSKLSCVNITTIYISI